MARKLLFAVDFSPYTEKILGCAGELAKVGMNEVVLAHVVRARDFVDLGEDKHPAHVAEAGRAEQHLSRLTESLEEQNLKVTSLIKRGDPADVLVELAREQDVDLIFMGAHGKGFLDRATMGSVSEKVLRKADRPVLIQQCRTLKERDGYTCENVCSSLFGHILVASDFSEYAEQVKPLLFDFAETVCAPVTLLYVEEGEEEARDKLQALSDELAGMCASVKFDMVRGSPPSAILSYADEVNASLIVLGAFGSRGITDGLLGSVAQKVMRGSDRPVLVLKGS